MRDLAGRPGADRTGAAAAGAGADGRASAHKAMPDMRRRKSGRVSVLRRVQRAIPVVTRSRFRE
jgi:hypothetical protein